MLVDPEDVSRDPQPICDAVPLSTDDATLLSKLLLDVNSWFFAVKRCLPSGTATIHLNARHGDAIVLIGMGCKDWQLKVNGQISGGFFDPVADVVRGILKRTFPEIASSGSQSMWKSGAITRLMQDKPSRQS